MRTARIGLFPHGSRGDVQPMLSLGRELRRRGHEVVLGAPPDFADAAASAGLQFHPIGRAARDHIAGNGADYSSGAARGAIAVHEYLLADLEAQLCAVPDAVAGCEVVLGAGLQVGAATAADAAGIPYRYVAYCPALLQSRAHAPILLPMARLPSWLNLLAWRLLKQAYNLRLLAALNRHRKSLGLAPIDDLYAHVMRRPILATDPELAAAPADCEPQPIQTGYLHDSTRGQLAPHIADFLDAGPAPVYVGFGSMGCPDPERATASILDALRMTGRRGIISHGWAELGRRALPPGVIGVGEVDHAALLPRVAIAVHHGGAGTTAAAARAGVPQILVPHIADQYYWAQRVEALGLGPAAVPRTILSAGRLARAFDRVAASSLYAERASHLGARLRDRCGLMVVADLIEREIGAGAAATVRSQLSLAR